MTMADTPASATAPEPATRQRRPAILAVDDEPAVLAAVARDLRRGFAERFRVLRAGSGQEALDLLRETGSQGCPSPTTTSAGVDGHAIRTERFGPTG